MTRPTFAALHPQPWRYVRNQMSLALVDANGDRIAALYPSVSKRKMQGINIPTAELLRHLLAGLGQNHATGNVAPAQGQPEGQG